MFGKYEAIQLMNMYHQETERKLKNECTLNPETPGRFTASKGNPLPFKKIFRLAKKYLRIA